MKLVADCYGVLPVREHGTMTIQIPLDYELASFKFLDELTYE
jgi:hypothetical protein